MADMPTFEWLISPTSPRVFFERHWDSNVLVQKREAGHYYADLLSITAIDNVISKQQLRFPDLAMAGEGINTSDYVRAEGGIDVHRVFALFAGGATIKLMHLERRLSSLENLCNALGSELSAPLHANTYLTPPHATGLPAHYDTHDVFMLQIEGRKSWKIFGSSEELPLRGQRFTPPGEPGPVVQEFDLAPGDLAYLPRGTYHSGQSGPEASLHLTLGVPAYTWTDLMLEAVAATSVSNASFRRSLPIGFARPGFETGDFQSTFRELVEEFVTSAEFEKALSGIKSAFDDLHQPTLEGRLSQATELGDATQDRTLRIRPDAVVEVHDVEGGIFIEFLSRRIFLPNAAREIIQFMIAHKEFCTSELPGALDLESGLAVVRRLVLEGLLEFTPPYR